MMVRFLVWVLGGLALLFFGVEKEMLGWEIKFCFGYCNLGGFVYIRVERFVVFGYILGV